MYPLYFVRPERLIFFGNSKKFHIGLKYSRTEHRDDDRLIARFPLGWSHVLAVIESGQYIVFNGDHKLVKSVAADEWRKLSAVTENRTTKEAFEQAAAIPEMAPALLMLLAHQVPETINAFRELYLDAYLRAFDALSDDKDTGVLIYNSYAGPFWQRLTQDGATRLSTIPVPLPRDSQWWIRQRKS